MKQPCVWVIKMLMAEGLWLPTIYCQHNRAAAQAEMSQNRQDNPAAKYRLRKYVRVE